jgi:hypothetical protein
MEFKTTFLEAARPIVKTITVDETISPPPPKLITSQEYGLPDNIDGIRKKFELMREYADKGGALYKGHFSRTLDQESRAGLTKKVKTRNIVFDFDDMVFPGYRPMFPMDETGAREMCNFVVSTLPRCFMTFHSSRIYQTAWVSSQGRSTST